MTPLSYDPLDYAASFESNQCEEGIIGIKTTSEGSVMKIITPKKLGEMFNQKSLDLRYTPKCMVVNPLNNNIIIVESNHRSFNLKEKQEISKEIYKKKPQEEISEKEIGFTKTGPGKWASCVRVVDSVELKTLDLFEIENNEAAISCYITTFADQQAQDSNEKQQFLFIGTIKDFIPGINKMSAGYIYTYRLHQKNFKLQSLLLHKTKVEGIPYTFCGFKGSLLAGIGNRIRRYDMGRKQLLKKTEMRNFQGGINTIEVFGDRIFVTDMSDSFHILKYRQSDNQFFEFADDILPRWITATCVLDYNTICGADKFENIFISRIPLDIDDELQDNPITY